MTSEHKRPFLKWAGSKFRLLPTIKKLLPKKGNRLIEPFAGSAAVSINSDYSQYILNDANNDLINLFKNIKRHKKKFISDAKMLFKKENNSAEYYYHTRNYFNHCDNNYEKSLLFLYLNRHGYNGLCRYNSSGDFNVPFGRYRSPMFPENALINFYQLAEKISFYNMDYKKVLAQAQAGDIVYCDPPYVSNHNSHFNYHHKSFTEEDQIELAELAEKTQKRGVFVMLSNHDTPFTRKVYANAKLHFVPVFRSINCKIDQRRTVQEIFAIYPPR